MTGGSPPKGGTAAPTDGTKARPIEVELKYRPASIAAGERILAIDDLAGLTAVAPTGTARFQDRYVDTADGALAKANFAARLRTVAGRTILSVKATKARGAGESGPHRREELEGPAGGVAGPQEWPPSDARTVLLEVSGGEPLIELLTIRQVRRRRVLRDDAATVELSLDEVEVVAGGEVVDRWVELEVELVKGDERRLLDVATVLAGDADLAPGRKSKLERGLAAVRAHRKRQAAAGAAVGGNGHAQALPGSPAGSATDLGDGASAEPGSPAAGHGAVAESEPAARDKPAKAAALPKSPGVVTGDHVAEAGRKILRFHFARMVAREAGTRDGSDPEELHAMRVATRRMRAGWRIFGSGFRGSRTKKLRSRLREVAARLGAVRDLDVLLDGLEAYRADLPATEQRGLQPLVGAWRGYRDDARELLLRELDSESHARFVEDVRVFVQTEGVAVRDVPPTEPHHVRDTAPSRIWTAYEQVRSYETVLRWADVETLHDLRIASKWLRYSLEFVREPLGADAEALIPRVVALQDHLGWLNDADVSSGMARSFLVERAGSLSEGEAAAIGRYLVSREREVARLRRTVGRPWRGVAGLAFRRRLGRAVASL